MYCRYKEAIPLSSYAAVAEVQNCLAIQGLTITLSVVMLHVHCP